MATVAQTARQHNPTPDTFTARLAQWTAEQAAFLASIEDWAHEAADMPSLDSDYVAAHTAQLELWPTYYAVQESDCVVALGNKALADAQYDADEARGGLVRLALGRR